MVNHAAAATSHRGRLLAMLLAAIVLGLMTANNSYAEVYCGADLEPFTEWKTKFNVTAYYKDCKYGVSNPEERGDELYFVYKPKCLEAKCTAGLHYCVGVSDTVMVAIEAYDQNGNPITCATGTKTGTQATSSGQSSADVGGTSYSATQVSSSAHTFETSGFGPEWDSSVQPRVQDNGVDGATVYFGDAMPVNLAKESEGVYTAEPTFTLTKNGSNFEVHYDDGTYLYFDTGGRAVSKVYPSGSRHEWLYDGSNRLQTIQAIYDDSGAVTSNIYEVQWDTAAPARITKLNNLLNSDAITYTYDSNALLTKVEGSCSSCSSAAVNRGYTYVQNGGAYKIEQILDGSDNRLFKTVYDVEGRVSTRYRATDQVYATYTYEELNNGIYVYKDYVDVEIYQYFDTNGFVTKAKTRADSTDYKIQEKYVDATGNITRENWISSISGGVTKWHTADFQVDANNRATLEVRYDYSEANPITVSRAAYNAYGMQTLFVGANNLTRVSEYSAASRLTKTTIQYGGQTLSTETWEYDANGQQITYIDRAGIVHTRDYDANGYLITKTDDPTGLAITEVYYPDSSGRVTKRTNANGNNWETYYASGGTVTKTKDPSGLVNAYIYDLDGELLTQQTYEDGGSVTISRSYAYDALGRRITATDARGATLYQYDDNDRVTYTESPDGRKQGTIYGVLGTAYSLAYNGTAWITKAGYEYDLKGRLTKQTDANTTVVSSTPAYDGYGRLTRSTDPLGHYTVYLYDEMDRLTRQLFYENGGATVLSDVQMAYDAFGQVTRSRRLANAGGSTGDSDAVTDQLYDDLGRVTKTTATLSGADASPTTNVQVAYFDTVGRVTKRTQDDGPDVTLDYDDAGNLLTQTIDPAGLAITTNYLYDELGRATRVTNPDSTYVVSIFDGLGKLTKTIQYDSSNNRLAVMGHIYDDALGLVTKTYRVAAPASRDTFNATDDPYTESLYTAAGRLTKTLDPNGNATTYDYDGLGRQITVTDAASNKQIVLYDDADRALTQKRLDYDGAAHITFATAMQYDGLNRVTKTIDQGPDGDITATTDNLTSIVWYDALGQITQTQDPAGKQMASTYDSLGRLTRTTEDSGGGGIARYTDRLYDRASRLTRLIGYTADATGAQNTDYAYNKAGVLTRSTYPDDNSGGGDRGYTENFYDAALRLTKVTDQEAQDTVIVYDTMSRRTAITKGTEVDTFTYNAAGQVTLARRGTSGNADAVSQSERLYDGLLRLTREAQSVRETAARNVDYAYDAAANVLTLTYPNGAAIATSYTANNQRNVISRGGSQLADYDYVGARPKSLIYETGANDVTFTPAYDGAARATRLATARNGTDIAAFNYSFDAASNITQKVLDHRSQTEAYTIDSLYRLTHAIYSQRTVTQGFIYDDLGNRLTLTDNATTTSALYNSANELTKLDATQVYYDKTGNVTKDANGNSYFYDRSKKLTRIEDNGSARIASYAYDPFNRRIEKDVENGETDTITRFYYTADWRLLEEADDAGTPNVQRYYVWGNYIDELLMFRDVIGTGGTANADYFAARDHLFGVSALIDTSGSVVERYEYDAYGVPHIMDASYGSRSSSIYGNNILFDGYYYDAESGLYCVRNRIYDPATMRWFQRDPLGTPLAQIAKDMDIPDVIRSSTVPQQYRDGVSLYHYLRAQPIKLIDPFGLCACSEKNCKWDGWIKGSYWGVLLGRGSIAFSASGVDDTGCVYQVSGSASKYLSGAIFGAGYWTTTHTFSDVPASCKWPVRSGSGGMIGIIGVNGQIGDIGVDLNLVHYEVGEFNLNGFFDDGGWAVHFAGGGWSVIFDNVEQTGP